MRTPEIAPDVWPRMFPAWLGELIDASASSTEAHPVCVALHALIGLGNLVGRVPHAMVGQTRHGVNLFGLIVGSTSTGRKGAGADVGLASLELADPLWEIASGLSSSEGVIHAVRDAVLGVDKKTGDRIVVDAGVEDKRLCIIETEFAQVLRMFRRDGNVLSTTLRQLWDGKRVLRTMTKGSPMRATEPHGSLVGHITCEDLRRHLDDVEIANGFANRFLIVAVNRARELPAPPPLGAPVLARLVEQVRAVVTHAQGVEYLERTPAAAAFWAARYSDLTRERPGLVGVLLARGPGHVMRLSTLFTLLMQAPAIDVPQLESAFAWWDYCTRSVRIIFGERTGNHVADRLRAEILPGGAMALDVVRREIFAGHITDARLKDAIELLVELGEFRVRKEETAGRSKLILERLPLTTEGLA